MYLENRKIVYNIDMNKQIVDKIFASKENLYKFIETLLVNATKERCKKYNVVYNDNIDKVVKVAAEYHTQRHFNAEFKEHALGQILSICNKTNAWDDIGCIIRCMTGIEEILLKIEPPDEFARLHGEMLHAVDEFYLEKFNLKQYL